jgi:hypothetical protein
MAIKWYGEAESNRLAFTLGRQLIYKHAYLSFGLEFFLPELRRNAIPHQTHAITLLNIAIEFSIVTSTAIDVALRTEAKISNPNEIAT